MSNRYWVGGGSSANWSATGNTNWSATSGGSNNASVPGATDDVIFDGAGTNGNTNSTISGTITVLSLTITTGYTATMTHNAVLTIAGNWTYVNTYTIAGTSGITISATSTITSNGVTWPNALTFGSATITLSGNLTVSGLLTIQGVPTIVNKTASETLTLSGGITGTSNTRTLSGTAKVILTGGTWSVNIITSDLDFNGNTTINGTVVYYTGILTYISGTVTTTSSTLNIAGSCTLNTNGVSWNNVSFISNTQTCTLTSNLTVNGLLTISATTTLNRTTAETVTVAGGITVSAALSGTAKVILTGGTWSGSSTLSTNLDIQGNVTVSGTVAYGTNTMTYVSGTVTTTGSTLNIQASCTLNTNGIIWNNVTFTTTNTTTLTSNLTINGLLSLTGGTSGSTTLNKTASEIVTVSGGITTNAAITGTADLYSTGGTISCIGNGSISNNWFLNGDIVMGALVNFSTRTLTYLSGSISTGGNTLGASACTLNTNGMTWNNFSTSGTNTIVLASNFLMNGLFSLLSNTTINRTTTETFTIGGGLYSALAYSLMGTTEVILTGGTWIGPLIVENNLTLNGNITISGNVRFYNKTLTYISGKIKNDNAILNLTISCTVLNFHKVPLKAVVITAGQTVTMNRFFSGTPSQICQVSSTGANYTITFQDNFEKMARYVSISGCTLSRPMQLLVTTNPKFNTNRTTNSGIRYNNQIGNGVARNAPSINDTMTAPAMMLASDPNFIMQ